MNKRLVMLLIVMEIIILVFMFQYLYTTLFPPPIANQGLGIIYFEDGTKITSSGVVEYHLKRPVINVQSDRYKFITSLAQFQRSQSLTN